MERKEREVKVKDGGRQERGTRKRWREKEYEKESERQVKRQEGESKMLKEGGIERGGKRGRDVRNEEGTGTEEGRGEEKERGGYIHRLQVHSTGAPIFANAK